MTSSIGGSNHFRREPEELEKEEEAHPSPLQIDAAKYITPPNSSSPTSFSQKALNKDFQYEHSKKWETKLQRPKVDGGMLSLKEMDQTDILRLRKEVRKEIKGLQEELHARNITNLQDLLERLPKDILHEIEAKILQEAHEKIKSSSTLEGLKSESFTEKPIHTYIDFCIQLEAIKYLVKQADMKALAIHEGAEKLLESLEQRLYEYACIESVHASHIRYFDDYTRSPTSQKLSKSASEYHASFLDQESINQAKSLLQFASDHVVKIHQAIATGTPEEIASLWAKTYIPTKEQVQEDLFRALYISPEGKTWSQILAAQPRVKAQPQRKLVTSWIKEIQKSYSDGQTKVLTPLRRHQAACHLLLNQLDELRLYLKSAKERLTVCNDGQTVIVGVECPFNLSTSSPTIVHMSADGEVTIRWRGVYTEVLSPGEKKTFPEEGCEVSLGSDGSLPIIKYTDENKRYISKKTLSVRQTWEGPILDVRTPGFLWGSYQDHYANLPSVLDESEAPLDLPPDIISSYILPRIQYNIQSFQERLEAQSTVQFSTPAELFAKEEEVRVQLQAVSDSDKKAASAEVESFANNHFHIFDHLKITVDQSSLKTALKEAEYATMHQAHLRFGRKSSYYIKLSQGLLSKLSSLVRTPYSSRKQIQILSDKLTLIDEKIDKKKSSEAVHEREEVVSLKLDRQKIKECKLWYEKEEVIFVIQKVIDGLTACNAPKEGARPKNTKAQRETLEKVYNACFYKLLEIEKKIASNAKEVIPSPSSESTKWSLSGYIGQGISGIMSHFKKYWYQQPSSEEVARRRTLADIGYNMIDGLNDLIGKVHTEIEILEERPSFSNVINKIRVKLSEVLKHLQDHPELGSTLVADLNQIQRVLSDPANTGAIDDYLSRIRVQCLSHAFLRGVPDSKKRFPVSPETIRHLQAICDAARILVPLSTGGSAALSSKKQTNILQLITRKIPYVGQTTSILVGAAWGALSQDFIRYSVNSLSEEVKEDFYVFAEAYRKGMQGVLKAQANLDIATSAGEMTKAVTDEGNILRNIVKRAGRTLKHMFVTRIGSVIQILKSDKSMANRLGAFVSLAAPVITGGLVLAGLFGVSALSGGILPAIFFGSCAFSAVFSNLARRHASAKQFLSKKISSIKERKKKKMDPVLKKMIASHAEKLVKEQHKYSGFDDELRAYLTEHEKAPENKAFYQASHLKQYADAERGDISFAEHLSLYLKERGMPFSSVDEISEKDRQSCYKQYFQRGLCHKFFKEKKQKEMDRLIEEAAELAAKDELGIESIEKAIKNRQQQAKELHDEIEKSGLTKQIQEALQKEHVHFHTNEIAALNETFNSSPDLGRPRLFPKKEKTRSQPRVAVDE